MAEETENYRENSCICTCKITESFPHHSSFLGMLQALIQMVVTILAFQLIWGGKASRCLTHLSIFTVPTTATSPLHLLTHDTCRTFFLCLLLSCLYIICRQVSFAAIYQQNAIMFESHLIDSGTMS